MTAASHVASWPQTGILATKKAALIGVLLAALAVAPFLPTLSGPFFWDDSANVELNLALRTSAGLKLIWTDPLASFQYYPVTYTLFWVQFQLFGERPPGYHAVSLLLHAMNAMLVWRCAFALKVPAPWWTAAFFAVHPIQVETVGWISEQKNLLSTLFTCLAILGWESFAGGRGSRHLIFATIAFLLGLASKSVVLVLPVFLLLSELFRHRAPIRRWLPPLMFWIAIGVAAGLVTSWRETATSVITGTPTTTSPDLPMDERMLLVCQNLWRYVGMLFCLEPFVPIPARSVPSWSEPSAIAALVGVVAVVSTAFALAFRGRPGILLGLSFFAIQLGPTLGMFRFQFQCLSFVADHFAYFACAGFFATVCGLFLQPPSAARSLAGAALLIVLCVFTWRQSVLFANPERLWLETMQANPTAWAAYANLSDLQLQRNDLHGALASAQRSAAVEPTNPVAHANAGLALTRLGRTADAEAPLREAVRLAPHQSRYYYYLGFLFLMQQRWQEAIDELRQAPDSAETLGLMGVAYLKLGRVAEARDAFKRALEIEPNLEAARNALAELDDGDAAKGR
jgi:protein O-mannosyl-transferase